MAAPEEGRTPAGPQLGLLDAGVHGEAQWDAPIPEEELALFTVAEGLSDLERVQLYLASDQPVQQLAAVANLPGLVRAAGRGAWAAVSPGLAATVRQLDGEGQLLAAEALAKLAGERLLPAADVAESILPLALAGALGEGGAAQAAVQAAWLACLGDAAGAVEPATLHSRVLPALAQCGAGGGRSTHDRCLCCKLLGAVLPHAGAGELAGALLRLGSALCQDTEWQVRHAAAAQLPALAAAAAGVDGFALAAVLDDVFAMADDEEALVRAAAWRALVASLDLLPPEARRGRALPALLRQCRDTDHHADVHRALTAGFGALLCKLVPDMAGDADVAACLACYRSLAWRQDHATRLNCAAAFAGVLRGVSARRYGSFLHDTLQRLAGDADAEVRLAVARGLPDVAAALGRERCGQYLRPLAAALLQDERREVAAALLGRLPELLGCFAPPPVAAAASSNAAVAAAAAAAAEAQRAKAFGPFVEPLLRLEAGSGHSWRLQAALLAAMPAFPDFFTPDQLHERFLPLALKHLGEGAAMLRAPAAAAAAALWRALRRPAHRTALYARLITGFAQSKCFRHRLAFVDFCGAALQLFSSAFFKAHLLEPALTLAYDPVANVRLHLAAAMPALKQVVALPHDVALLELLNNAMSHLITDGDADVCGAARKANEEFKRQPVRMSCGALEGSPPGVKAYEAADAARAAAEAGWAFEPEPLEAVKAAIAAHSERWRPAEARLALALPSMRGEAGATSRLGSSSSTCSGGRGPGPAARGRGPLAAAAGGAGAQRSSSDGPEARRERRLLGSGSQARSASMDGHRRASGAGSSSSPGSAAATSRSRPWGQLRGGAGAAADASPPSNKPAATAASVLLPAAAGDSPAGVQDAAAAFGAPAAPATAADAARRQQPSPSSSASRLGRPSPSAAALAKASRLGRPSPSPVIGQAGSGGGSSQQMLAGPPAAAAQPAVAAAAAAAGASRPRSLAAAGSAMRRPSFQARAAAEVQQLASRLRSALLSPKQRQGAGGPLQPDGSRAASSSSKQGGAGGVSIRVRADGGSQAEGHPPARHASLPQAAKN